MGSGAGSAGSTATRQAGLATISRLGPRTGALIVVNSVRRRRQARRERDARRPSGPWCDPGPLVDVEAPPGAPSRFRFERATLQVRMLADDAVELCWGPWPVPPSDALVPVPGGRLPAVPTSTEPTEDGWLVRAPGVTVRVAQDAVVRVAGPDGPVLRTEGPPTMCGTWWRLPFGIRPAERLGGLGEQAAGVDRRGGRHVLWNRDPGGAWGPGRDPLYLGVPVLVGSHPDGHVLVLHDNPFRATVDLGEPAATQAGTGSVSLDGGPLRHVVVVGPPARLLDRYTALTGRPALPPRWALGYHQSRWGYRTQADVAEVSDGFADEGVPLSAVHLDIDYMDRYRVFTEGALRLLFHLAEPPPVGRTPLSGGGCGCGEGFDGAAVYGGVQGGCGGVVSVFGSVGEGGGAGAWDLRYVVAVVGG